MEISEMQFPTVLQNQVTGLKGGGTEEGGRQKFQGIATWGVGKVGGYY